MTAISILGGDFEILFDDETAGGDGTTGLKMVRRATGAADNIYTTRQLYSAIADASDDFQAMGFENPMLPVTPNAYTMENFYFIPRSSTEWLKEGAISANWTVSGTNGVIRRVHAAGGTQPVAADIGYTVTEATSGDTGTLLDFEIEPDGTRVLWIRPDDASTDLFDQGAVLLTTTQGMSVTGDAAAATSGNTLYSSIQAIGSVPTATEVYLIQDRIKIANAADNTGFQFWSTDPDVSLGIIDILIRVQNATASNVYIAEGDVEVFARRYTALYDNFRLNVATGGRSALPLASAPDINNTTGYLQLTGTTGSASDFDVGNHIYVGATYATATKKGVITAVTGTVDIPIIAYYLIGDLTDFANLDAIKEYDPVAGADGDGTTTVNGAPIANPGGPTDVSAGEGGTVTITPAIQNIDHDGDATNEPYSIVVDCQLGNEVPAAKVYERLKYVTRRGATGAELFGAVTNIPGETYRGITAIIEGDASTVNMTTEGQDLTSGTGNWTAKLIAHNHTPAPALPGGGEYITVTDEQTSIDSVADNYVISGATEGDMTINTSVSPDFGIVSVSSPKSSPFGTFTGTQIFGARGVAFINPHSADTQNYILTDDLGNLNSPPNTVSFIVNNTLPLDRVLVAEDTAGNGIINKDKYGGLLAGNSVGDTTIVVSAGGLSGQTEIPASAYVRVVDVELQEEHRYVYNSRVLSTDTFNLRLIDIGDGIIDTTDTTPDGNGNYTLFGDAAGANFQQAVSGDNGPVDVGMLVHNTTATKGDEVYEVVSVDSATQLTIRPLYGAGGGFTAGDTYVINVLIAKHDSATYATTTDYAATANIYDLHLDVEAVGTTTSNTFVESTSPNRAVVNVRQGKVILPFTANPDITAAGGATSVVRSPDTIAQ